MLPFFQMVLSEELQSLVGFLLQMVQGLTNKMGKIVPVISKLQNYLLSVRDLNLNANNEFSQVRIYCTVPTIYSCVYLLIIIII